MIDSEIPINYFVLYHDKVYQFSTPLFDVLWDYYVVSNKGGQPLYESLINDTYNQ